MNCFLVGDLKRMSYGFLALIFFLFVYNLMDLRGFFCLFLFASIVQCLIDGLGFLLCNAGGDFGFLFFFGVVDVQLVVDFG